MNTQNIKTAASESSERWGETHAIRTDGFVRNLYSANPFDVIRADVVIKRLKENANRGCGLYWEVYESRLMDSAMNYLLELPLKDRPVFMGAASVSGFMLTLSAMESANDAYVELMAELRDDY